MGGWIILGHNHPNTHKILVLQTIFMFEGTEYWQEARQQMSAIHVWVDKRQD
jgi:hypothetical protein